MAWLRRYWTSSGSEKPRYVKRKYVRMSPEQKPAILRAAECSSLPKSEAPCRLDMPRRTCYRRLRVFRLQGKMGLQDLWPYKGRAWNQILPEEPREILEVAMLWSEWPPREVACRIWDCVDFVVSEFTVYRVLKKAGWLKAREGKTCPANSEYAVKTTGPNEQWQTDATFFKAKVSGWDYLISVLDDYSRRILAWPPQKRMDAGTFSEVVEPACEATDADQLPSLDRGRLVTDRSPALISQDFGDYLEAHSLGHVPARSYHRQINGKIEQISPKLQGAGKPGCSRDANGAGARDCTVRGVLQSPSLS